MNTRINEGYTISDSIQIGETEFVLGKSGGAFTMFVTWACKGGDYYYWGHYFSDLLEAKKDLLDRAGEELEVEMERRARTTQSNIGPIKSKEEKPL